ncbi:transcriptional regulator [Pasteurellaceae bacterium 15-036681]|nr:transcriptional regulator [Pasteurellaceae bacterium 15-036681]
MASLKDVAKLAGVSLMTVSRAINSPEQLSKKTYLLVKQAIEELNYVPNLSAQKIRGAGSANQSIGVLSLDIATTPFSVEILLAIEKTVRKYGWNSFIVNTFDDNLDQAVETLISHRPTAIIIARSGLQKIHIPSALRSYPIVLANCLSDDVELASYIPNDEQGQYEATQLLIEKGYKKPLCLFLEEDAPATQARFQGFKRAILGKDIVFTEPFFLKDDYLEILQPLQEMLRKRPLECDVIVCGNDRIALIAYQYLLSQGVSIPQDIAIIGFDNMVGVADLFYPALTTVQLPHYEIGEQATLHLIEGREHRTVQRIECPLISRSSC